MRALDRAKLLSRFYLAGGTGLALQMGHRLSLDLDFFSLDHFDEEVLLQRVQAMQGFVLVSKAPYTLHCTLETTRSAAYAYSAILISPKRPCMRDLQPHWTWPQTGMRTSHARG